jgi:hypothetical protein
MPSNNAETADEDFVDDLDAGALELGSFCRNGVLSRCCRRDRFISFNCAHCGAAGYAHDHGCAAPDPVKIARFQAEAAERARIEDALNAHQATGMGAWAAAGAGRMAVLADTVPTWMSTITVQVDGNADGRKGAAALADPAL